jgi:hypothetical protein
VYCVTVRKECSRPSENLSPHPGPLPVEWGEGEDRIRLLLLALLILRIFVICHNASKSKMIAARCDLAFPTSGQDMVFRVTVDASVRRFGQRTRRPDFFLNRGKERCSRLRFACSGRFFAGTVEFQDPEARERKHDDAPFRRVRCSASGRKYRF